MWYACISTYVLLISLLSIALDDHVMWSRTLLPLITCTIVVAIATNCQKSPFVHVVLAIKLMCLIYGLAKFADRQRLDARNAILGVALVVLYYKLFPIYTIYGCELTPAQQAVTLGGSLGLYTLLR